MIFARAMLLACMTVLGALCVLVAFLLLALLAVSYARGDNADPASLLGAAAAFAAGGVACRWIARRLA